MAEVPEFSEKTKSKIACDMHIRKLLDNSRKRGNQLHKVISNRNINLNTRRHLLLSVIRPSIWK